MVTVRAIYDCSAIEIILLLSIVTHRMLKTDQEPKQEINGACQSAKGFKVLSVVLTIVLVVSVAVASGFLASKQNEIHRLNQQEEDNHSEQEQLKNEIRRIQAENAGLKLRVATEEQENENLQERNRGYVQNVARAFSTKERQVERLEGEVKEKDKLIAKKDKIIKEKDELIKKHKGQMPPSLPPRGPMPPPPPPQGSLPPSLPSKGPIPPPPKPILIEGA